MNKLDQKFSVDKILEDIEIDKLTINISDEDLDKIVDDALVDDKFDSYSEEYNEDIVENDEKTYQEKQQDEEIIPPSFNTKKISKQGLKEFKNRYLNLKSLNNIRKEKTEQIVSIFKREYLDKDIEGELKSSYKVDDKTDQNLEVEETKMDIKDNLKDLLNNLYFRAISLGIIFILSTYYGFTKYISFLAIPNQLRVETNPNIFLGIQLFFLIASIVISYTTIFEGIVALIKIRPDRDTSVAISTIGSFVQNIFLISTPSSIQNSDIHLYSSIAIGIILFNVIGKIFIVKRTILNYKFLSKNEDKKSLDINLDEKLSCDLTKGIISKNPILGYTKNVLNNELFIEKSFGYDILDYFMKYITPISLLLSLIIGIITYFITLNAFLSISILTGLLCMCSPFCLIFSLHLPFYQTIKKINKEGVAILNISDIQDYGEINSVAVEACDIFPEKSIALVGIDTFCGQRIDESIIHAASVLHHVKSIFSHVFMDVILNRKDILKQVTSFVYEEGLGIAAWVENKRILIGTRQFLLNYGIDVPVKKYEEKFTDKNITVLYLSNCGELSSAFVLKVDGDSNVLQSLIDLQYSKVCMVVKTVDPFVTRDIFSKLFSINNELIKVIPIEMHDKFDEMGRQFDDGYGNILCKGNIYSLVETIVSLKRMKSTFVMNIIVMLTSIIVGCVLILLFGMLSITSQISIPIFLIYQLLCVFTTYIIGYSRL